MSGNPNWDSPKLRIGSTSFVTPVRIYDVDLATGERTLLREQPVLGDYRPEDYVERRDWAVAADGARVPVSIIHRVGLQFPAPTLLYGYGAYESCEDPRFSIARLSLLDRGMVFVIAHVRGGGELGRPWYEHGKLLEKVNTFTDFVAVAAHLVNTDVTRPENLVALGGSAGGLLIGAVANMAPQLFAGFLAQVPFVDALTTILDPSLPLTVTEWDEWGNPLADEDVYYYMKSYSPYENVTAKDYPPILAMTSLNDTRVLYVEPAKWVAALRHTKTDAPSGAVEDRDERRPRWNQRPIRALEGGGVPVRMATGHRQGQPRGRRLRRRPARPFVAAAAWSSTSAGSASATRRRSQCRPGRPGLATARAPPRAALDLSRRLRVGH